MSDPKNWTRTAGRWSDGTPGVDYDDLDPVDRAIDGELAKQDEQERGGP